MRRLLHASAFWAAMAAAFVGGVALTGAARWLGPLREGMDALHAGDYATARDRLAAAEARFDRLPAARRLLPGAYAAARANQFLALYALGRHDEILEKAAAGEGDAASHFWSGCVLFGRAAGEKDEEPRIAFLTRASAEFRRALEKAPQSWDAKFNYELSERLLADLREPPRKPPKTRLQLLRPEPREGHPPARRVG